MNPSWGRKRIGSCKPMKMRVFARVARCSGCHGPDRPASSARSIHGSAIWFIVVFSCSFNDPAVFAVPGDPRIALPSSRHIHFEVSEQPWP
ncbi:hypothetical protein D779_2777 [Imhoffiella purpurea]|uniref:Uncharacterized protein n=1 Tax=Imhoffiella purpurea TaxID=1249627 RepID=W9VE31_9GAMM|nr:hypothetical protein D779_2777 [Imhoffiella purpurea]